MEGRQTIKKWVFMKDNDKTFQNIAINDNITMLIYFLFIYVLWFFSNLMSKNQEHNTFGKLIFYH